MGTIRTSVSLANVVRFVERRMIGATKDQLIFTTGNTAPFSGISLLIWGNVTPEEDNELIENCGDLLSLDCGAVVQTPSMLAREQGKILRPEVVTSSDFLLPELLLKSSGNKIYGFYYIL